MQYTGLSETTGAEPPTYACAREKAFIFAFKVLSRDDNETVFEDTVANALRQIEQKKYAAELIADGFAPENIRKYGFAFEGKKCLTG